MGSESEEETSSDKEQLCLSSYSSEEEEASREGTKVLSLRRLASKAMGQCFLNGRAEAYRQLKGLPCPAQLIHRVLRYVPLSESEWLDFARHERATISPTWNPEGSPLQRRVEFYERRYGKNDFSSEWDFVWRSKSE